MLDATFDDAETAEKFLEVMRTQVWPDPSRAPAKVGVPRSAVLELVESHDY
ncbi:MAG: hypothetical protein QOJ60_2491 [Actinomycetota bacterium]|jgi:hypothetical protein|nr:hypothetical protein [Actinomycetota bacterium]